MIFKPLAALAAALLAIGTGSAGSVRSAVEAPFGSYAKQREAAASIVAKLSGSQIAGQRVIYSYAGLVPPDALLERIRRGDAAGVVFFAGNIASKAQIRRVTSELEKAAASSPVKAPLLLMTDEEGGLVRRLRGPPLPSEKQVGSASHPDAAAARAGAGAARNLSSAGMNVNLAPVLGVYRVRGDFLDRFERSYGRRAGAVASLGRDFIAAQQKHGVAATAKHFPGLGAAEAGEDTDEAPVRIDVPLGTLRMIDERPFRSAIAAGVRLVMVSWATYPALDGRRPAGLAGPIARAELRKRLHFSGVTITDALEAGALQPFGGISRRAVLAARAGMDLMLCSGQSVGEGAEASVALASATRDGRVSRRGSLQAAERIIALRLSLER